MEAALKNLVEQIDGLRVVLHRKVFEADSATEVLSLSQSLDQLILEYLKLERTMKS